jgi:predicted molibdopterin-dependent oxidoreductase YjgC
MPEKITCTIDGRELQVVAGTSVAAAIMLTRTRFRRSVQGEPRGAICGMGICFECRATVDGETQRRTCQLLCEDGMDVKTDE